MSEREESRLIFNTLDHFKKPSRVKKVSGMKAFYDGILTDEF